MIADYNKVLKFAECQGIELFSYQKVILLALCEGLEIRVPRAAGRSFVVKLLADFLGDREIVSAFDRNNYDIESDIILSYRPVVRDGVLDQNLVDKLGEEFFEKDIIRD